MARKLAHYALLILTVFAAVVYWGLTYGGGYLSKSVEGGFRPAPSGMDAVLLHPVVSFVILLMAVALVMKEFRVKGLGKRALLNALALLLVVVLMTTLVTA